MDSQSDRAPAAIVPTLSLCQAFNDSFLIGAALNTAMVDGRSPQASGLAARHFSTLTAENDMKWERLHLAPGQYQFEATDAYVEFAQTHGMAMVGHTLVWHSQTPKWVFEGADGQEATRGELIERMRDHISTVAGRYRGSIRGWDVVNEAIADQGEDALRDSPWRRIIGDDFLDVAFRFARETDPAAELYYNDYNLEQPGKRQRALNVLRGMIKRGVPLDGVGLQGHYHLKWPALAEIEETIEAFAALGLKVMITELDVDVLPRRGDAGIADIAHRETPDATLNPYVDGLPEDVQQQLAQRYAELFSLFLRHRDVITRVTFWGLDDGHSWLNGFPIRGRTNHPLLFDRDLRPKPAFFAVLDAGSARQEQS